MAALRRVFTAPLDGRDAFVYVLAGHQSSDDPFMAFRVLGTSPGSGTSTSASTRRPGGCLQARACELRGLIEPCTDLNTLNVWFRRAFKADKPSDPFE